MRNVFRRKVLGVACGEKCGCGPYMRMDGPQSHHPIQGERSSGNHAVDGIAVMGGFSVMRQYNASNHADMRHQVVARPSMPNNQLIILEWHITCGGTLQQSKLKPGGATNTPGMTSATNKRFRMRSQSITGSVRISSLYPHSGEDVLWLKEILVPLLLSA